MITAADLLQPKGPLSLSLFPGEGRNEYDTRVGQYITDAYADERVAAQTDQTRADNLARAFALHKAFTDVVVRLSGEPISVSVTEKGGHSYSGEQIKTFERLAAKYWGDFLGLLVIEGSVPPTQMPGSVSVRNSVEW